MLIAPSVGTSLFLTSVYSSPNLYLEMGCTVCAVKTYASRLVVLSTLFVSIIDSDQLRESYRKESVPVGAMIQ